MKKNNLIPLVILFLALHFNVNAFGASQTVTEALTMSALKNLSLKVVKRNVVYSNQTHQIAEIVLSNKYTGEIKLYEKLPTVRTLGQLPTMFMLSGLQTGRDAIHLTPDAENMRIVTYEYPVGESEDSREVLVHVLDGLPRITAQIVAAYVWLSQQSDVDTSQFYSFNISFGSYIAPPALRLLGQLGVYPSRTIFAFGGSDLEPFILPEIEKNLPSYLDHDRERILSAVKKASREVDFNRHLKHLKGPFLVIRGLRDSVIPAGSSLALVQNLPQPLTVVELDTDHIDTDTPDVITQTLRVVMDWLSTPL